MSHQKKLDSNPISADIMNKDRAKEVIREVAKVGNILLTDHCRTKMRERNVSTQDVLYVLMWGDVQEIKKDAEHNNWKCEIQGKDLEDDILTVQAAVSEDERTIVITVY